MIVVGLVVLSVVSGMLGLGVAFAAVPFLSLFLPDLVHQVQPLSLLLNGITGFAATLGFARSGFVNWKKGGALAIVATVFAPLGSLIATHTAQRYVWYLYFLAVVYLAYRMFRPVKERPGNENFKLALLLIIPIAVLSGFLGVGPGFLLLPTLMLLGFEDEECGGHECTGDHSTFVFRAHTASELRAPGLAQFWSHGGRHEFSGKYLVGVFGDHASHGCHESEPPPDDSTGDRRLGGFFCRRSPHQLVPAGAAGEADLWSSTGCYDGVQDMDSDAMKQSRRHFLAAAKTQIVILLAVLCCTVPLAQTQTTPVDDNVYPGIGQLQRPTTARYWCATPIVQSGGAASSQSVSLYVTLPWCTDTSAMDWLSRGLNSAPLSANSSQTGLWTGLTLGWSPRTVLVGQMRRLGLLVRALIMARSCSIIPWATASSCSESLPAWPYAYRCGKAYSESLAALERSIRNRHAQNEQVPPEDVDRFECGAQEFSRKLLNTPPEDVLQIDHLAGFHFPTSSPNLIAPRSDVIDRDLPRTHQLPNSECKKPSQAGPD